MDVTSQSPRRKRRFSPLLLTAFWLAAGGAMQSAPVAAERKFVEPQTIVNLMSDRISGGQLSGKDLADAYFTRGLFRFQLFDTDGAISDYSQAIATQDGKDFRQRRAEAYLFKGDYTDSLADFGAVAAMDPGAPDAHLRRAEIFQMTGDQASHDAEMKQAFALTKYPAGLVSHGSVFQEVRGNYQIAYNDATAALAMAPGNILMTANRGQFAIPLGKYQDAIADLDVALKADPQQRVAQNTFVARMIALYALGRYEEASPRLPEANVSDPYIALWADIVQSRLPPVTMPAPGTGDLKKVDIDTDNWPGPILFYNAGALSEADLLTAVDNDGKPEQRDDRRCEFQFYVGEHRRIRGDKDGAAALLRVAAQTCPYGELERSGARIELRAMGLTAP